MVDDQSIRPIILAGGLGTRLRPRTDVLPKPLLPVLGRPLLWYAIESTKHHRELRPPIVAIAYKADLVRAYFDSDRVAFREVQSISMAEAFLTIAESDDSDAFLGMSSDVLMPPSVVEFCIKEFQSHEGQDTLILTTLPSPGHKKWNFVVEDGLLRDIRKAEIHTKIERALLILRKSSIDILRQNLLGIVSEDSVPKDLIGFQTGWTLLLKTLALARVPIRTRIAELPVCNINDRADLEHAVEFVMRHNAPKG